MIEKYQSEEITASGYPTPPLYRHILSHKADNGSEKEQWIHSPIEQDAPIRPRMTERLERVLCLFEERHGKVAPSAAMVDDLVWAFRESKK